MNKWYFLFPHSNGVDSEKIAENVRPGILREKRIDKCWDFRIYKFKRLSRRLLWIRIQLC